MPNNIAYLLSFFTLPAFIFGLLGLILGWVLWGRNKQAGDLSIEGEGQLRAESDSLRARVNELEGKVGTRDGEISGLKKKLTAGSTTVAATGGKDDDETYALEWRNRYLAARVKYLEGRITDAPKAKKKPAAKKRVVKKVVRKTVAKKAAKPRILYDKPTDGKPDDLKLISGVGPKLEKMLNKTGVYYFPQIANWKKADVKMVNDKLGAFPGRIERDEWVRQAKGLAKGTTKPAKKAVTKKTPAKKTVTKKAAPKKAPAKKIATKPSKAKTDPNAKYLAEVRKYDSKASAAVVNNIVKYCGISLRSRDASLVACSDEKELNTVAKGFCTKKLGMTKGQMECVKDVCGQMKAQRFKNRVTFYYLCAKQARKMKVFR